MLSASYVEHVHALLSSRVCGFFPPPAQPSYKARNKVPEESSQGRLFDHIF